MFALNVVADDPVLTVLTDQRECFTRNVDATGLFICLYSLEARRCATCKLMLVDTCTIDTTNVEVSLAIRGVIGRDRRSVVGLVGGAALNDAVLACLARRPRDIPSTLGYFHATLRSTRSERTSARARARAMPIAA